MDVAADRRFPFMVSALLPALMLAVAFAPVSAAPVRLSAAEADWRERAAALPVGSRLELSGVSGEGRAMVFDLERFEVFPAGAQVVVHRLEGDEVVPPPASSTWNGPVRGEPGSRVFLSLHEDGEIAGLLFGGDGRVSFLGAAASGSGLAVVRIDPAAGKKGAATFQCEPDLHPRAVPPLRGRAPAGVGATTPLSAELAIETDWELWNLFGDAGRASAYVGDLVGAVSTLYQRDLLTTLKVRHLSLWAGGPSTDPWSATNVCVALAELGSFWHAQRSGVVRDTVHFLSGKSLGGGIAWIGTLCSADFAEDLNCGSVIETFAGGYGLTSEISGNFDPRAPAVLWDIFAVAHEIGHNFGSPHTHCYRNFPSSAFPDPVDLCTALVGDAACNEGAVNVPEGGGSLMSYCHQREGGMANMNLSFGREGAYGVHSERVPQRMRAFAESVASCLGRRKTSPADFSGDGRSDTVVYRNGAWVFIPIYPGV